MASYLLNEKLFMASKYVCNAFTSVNQIMKTMRPCHAVWGSFENDLSGKDEREMGKHVVKAN